MTLPMDLYPQKRRLSPIIITILVVICCLSSTALAVLYFRNRPSPEVDRSAIVAQTVTAMALSRSPTTAPQPPTSPMPAQTIATQSSSQSPPTPVPDVPTPTLTATSTPLPTPAPIPTGLVSVDVLNFRTGPDTTYGVIGQLKKNDRLELLARNEVGTWLQVRTEAGREGWVFAEYVYTTVNIVTLQIAAEVPPPK